MAARQAALAGTRVPSCDHANICWRRQQRNRRVRRGARPDVSSSMTVGGSGWKPGSLAGNVRHATKIVINAIVAIRRGTARQSTVPSPDRRALLHLRLQRLQQGVSGEFRLGCRHAVAGQWEPRVLPMLLGTPASVMCQFRTVNSDRSPGNAARLDFPIQSRIVPVLWQAHRVISWNRHLAPAQQCAFCSG
jgi:hypothetical protein